MWKRAIAKIALAAALLYAMSLVAAQGQATFTGRVVGIADGDTLTVLVEGPKGKRTVKVRLHGVDAPESRQPYGTQARQRTAALAMGQTSTVEVRDTDRYGRTVGVVTVRGRDVGAALVASGLAWWYREYAPDDTGLQQLEEGARRDRRGLWADKAPVPPWEWRKGEASRRSSPTTERSAPQERQEPTANAPAGATVYGTNTGKRYHRDGCSGLSRSRIPMTRTEAERRGLTPCRLCRP